MKMEVGSERYLECGLGIDAYSYDKYKNSSRLHGIPCQFTRMLKWATKQEFNTVLVIIFIQCYHSYLFVIT